MGTDHDRSQAGARGARGASAVLWRAARALGAVLFGLVLLVHVSGGFSLHLGPIHATARHARGLFLALAALTGLRLACDPSWTRMRRALLALRLVPAWMLFLAGAASVGLSLWAYDDPHLLVSLFASPASLSAQCVKGLVDQGCFALALAVGMLILNAHAAGAAGAGAPSALRRASASLLPCVAGLAASVLLAALCAPPKPRTHAMWPFFLWVPAWSIAIASGISDWAGRTRLDIRRPRITAAALLWTLIVTLTAVFAWMAVRKLDQHLGAGDFPVYLQPLWNTLHGRFMSINWFYTGPGISECWFAEHLNIINLALLPVYRATGDPRSLVVLQAALTMVAAWPLYLLARRELRSHAVALALALSYLVNPLVTRALLFDFHSEAAIPALVFATFLFMESRRALPWSAAVLLLLLCKEDVSLYLIAFGIYGAVFGRNYRFAAASALVGVAWLALAVGAFIPHFSEGPRAYHTIAMRYPALGSDVRSAVTTILTQPQVVLRLVLDSTSLHGWGYLLLPLAGLPLLHPAAWLLFAAPSLEMFLSQFSKMKALGLHYPWFVVPFYYIGAVVVLRRLLSAPRFSARFTTRGIAVYLAVTALVFQHLFDPYPPACASEFHARFLNPSPIGRHFSRQLYIVNDHDRAGRRMIDEVVPCGAALSTDMRFAHDLADRQVLRLYPETGDVQFVFIDTRGLPYNFRMLRSHRQHAVGILAGARFGVRAYDDGYLLLERGYSTNRNLEVAIEASGFLEPEEMPKRHGRIALDGLANNKRALLVDRDVTATDDFLVTPPLFCAAGPVAIALHVRQKGFARDASVLRMALIDHETGEELGKLTVNGEAIASDRYTGVSFRGDNSKDRHVAIALRRIGAKGELWVDHIRYRSLGLTWRDLMAGHEEGPREGPPGRQSGEAVP